MPRSSRLEALGTRLAGVRTRWNKDPRLILRAGAIVLVAANLVAAFLTWRPVGGSRQDLERQVVETRRQVVQRQAALERLRALVKKVEKGRAEGDRFLNDNFLSRRTAYSTLVAELDKGAQKAGMKPREHAFNEEPIEGSDTLGILSISANYEGSYADLIQFVHMLDVSPRFLIIESLQAAPQQSGGLTVSMRLDAFVREGGPEK